MANFKAKRIVIAASATALVAFAGLIACLAPVNSAGSSSNSDAAPELKSELVETPL
jgi:hypothetical protein